MQLLEVSGAVRHIYVIRQLKVNANLGLHFSIYCLVDFMLKEHIHCTYFLTENNAENVSLFSDSITLTSVGQQLQQLTRYKARSLFKSTQLFSYEDTQRTCGSEVSSPYSQKLLTGSYHDPVQSRPHVAIFPLHEAKC